MYSFAGISGRGASGIVPVGDGAIPNGGLVLDGKGNIYGTTQNGGSYCSISEAQGCGIVFRLDRPAQGDGSWAEEILHRFSGQPKDGAGPAAGVTLDVGGDVFGTTIGGGREESGTIFELSAAANWTETVLKDLVSGEGGASPQAQLVFDGEQRLMGPAYAYGKFNGGTLFQLVLLPSTLQSLGSSYSVVYNFTKSPDGAHPVSGLLFDKEGNVFGTTESGGTSTNCAGGCGTVYESIVDRNR